MGAPPPGGRPPGSGGGRGVQALLQGGFEVKGTEYIAKAWEALKPHLGIMIGLTVVIAVVGGVLGVILGFVMGGSADQMALMQGGFSAGLMGKLMAKRMVSNLLVTLVTTPLVIGLMIAARDVVRGRAPSFAAIGEGFKHLVPVIIYSLITGIATMLGLLLCVLPGIFLAVCFNRGLGTYLIIDQGMSFSDAMSAAFKITLKNWFGFFVFFLLLILVNIAGAIACLVGLLVTIPLSVSALAVMYDDLVGFES